MHLQYIIYINMMCMLGGNDPEVQKILTMRTLELGESDPMLEATSLINKCPTLFKLIWVFSF